MPVSVSRKSLFPLAAELICARLTLRAIAAAPAGKEWAGEQAAILERKPGIGICPIGEAHAEALILPSRAAVVASPVFRGQRKRRQLDLVGTVTGRALLRIGIRSCHHHRYSHRTLAQGI